MDCIEDFPAGVTPESYIGMRVNTIPNNEYRVCEVWDVPVDILGYEINAISGTVFFKVKIYSPGCRYHEAIEVSWKPSELQLPPLFADPDWRI